MGNAFMEKILKNKMDRKGDVPLVLLFLVALVLSLIALFIFASFSNDIESKSVEFTQLASELEFKQNYIIMQASVIARDAINSGNSDLMADYRGLAGKNDIIVDGGGNFFLKVQNSEFIFIG